MDKTTIYLPRELRRALTSYVRRSGRRQSDVVREALGTYLAQQEDDDLPLSVGFVDDGSFDAAQYEDELGRAWEDEQATDQPPSDTA